MYVIHTQSDNSMSFLIFFLHYLTTLTWEKKNELKKKKNFKGRVRGLIDTLSCNLLEGLRKTMKTSVEYIWCLSLDSNRSSPPHNFECRVLPLCQTSASFLSLLFYYRKVFWKVALDIEPILWFPMKFLRNIYLK